MVYQEHVVNMNYSIQYQVIPHTLPLEKKDEIAKQKMIVQIAYSMIKVNVMDGAVLLSMAPLPTSR